MPNQYLSRLFCLRNAVDNEAKVTAYNRECPCMISDNVYGRPMKIQQTVTMFHRKCLLHYSRVPNTSVGPINSVGGGKYPKFNNSVGRV